VFVVASARADFDPAAVLFEFDGVRRDIAPSRKAGETVAPTIAGCANGGGANGPGRDVDSVESLQPYAVGNTLTARMHKGMNSTLDEGQTPVISIQDVTPREKAQNGKGWSDDGTSYTVDTHATQGVALPIGFDSYNHAVTGDVSKTLDVGQDYHHVPNVFQPIPFDTTQITSPANYSRPQAGDACHPLAAGAHVPAIAFHPTQDPISSTDLCHSLGANENATAAVAFDTYNQSVNSHTSQTIKSPQGAVQESVGTVLQAMQVRRLTPVECERLQGFPDGYTEISWRKKPATECPDGPRYKALGNSWAVPVVRWIGKRIEMEIKCKPKK
jgi:DNA (cytosine-5)-methyltransferase 1